ncbi:MAG: hypothetical protein Q7T86_19460 [Hyphomicrobiaceae bacterium]|nr:hypothetical protein [Hyphomicrobiaceae bacterium]
MILVDDRFEAIIQDASYLTAKSAEGALFQIMIVADINLSVGLEATHTPASERKERCAARLLARVREYFEKTGTQSLPVTTLYLMPKQPDYCEDIGPQR